jgi:hypothetical protein
MAVSANWARDQSTTLINSSIKRLFIGYFLFAVNQLSPHIFSFAGVGLALSAKKVGEKDEFEYDEEDE